uniref:Zinc ribbon domain-containing protein n=1 Tax=Caldimicrobium thiodismutans TaxID=1653476 RepID=A0A832LWP3_9BACT
MPIFEFKCLDCGAEFEVLLKNKEEISKVNCKACQSPRVERLMSVVHSLLRGSTSTKEGDRPRIAESHSCPTGTCTHLELPGHTK